MGCEIKRYFILCKMFECLQKLYVAMVQMTNGTNLTSVQVTFEAHGNKYPDMCKAGFRVALVKWLLILFPEVDFLIKVTYTVTRNWLQFSQTK